MVLDFNFLFVDKVKETHEQQRNPQVDATMTLLHPSSQTTGRLGDITWTTGYGFLHSTRLLAIIGGPLRKISKYLK